VLLVIAEDIFPFYIRLINIYETDKCPTGWAAKG